MTSNRKPFKRQVRCLYKALLRESGVRVTVKELVGFYEEYNVYRQSIQRSLIAPSTLKVALPPIRTPQYVDWVEQYLVREK